MAGSEAAWQAANAGVHVVIHEMRPKVGTFAHQTGFLGEMVCSNSFRSDDDEQNAVGLLHWEMRAANGLIMATADKHRLPAGGALAVDRDPFAESVTAALMAHPNISLNMAKSQNCPRWPLDHRDGPADLGRSGECDCGRNRRRGAGVFRCHRADRLSRQHRHDASMDAIAL